MMQNFHRLTLFIWLVSLLTLSVSDEIKTDGTNLTSALNARLTDNATKTEHRISAEITPESTNSTKTQNYVATPSVAGEGGPIPINPNTQQTSTTSHLTLNIQTNLSKEEEDNQYEKQKKYISKIVSRKGANDKRDNTSSVEVVSSDDTKPVVELSTVPSDTHNKDKINTNMYNSKSSITDKHIDNASTVVNNTSADVTQRNILTNAPVTASTVQEHKPKPTATVVGPNSDKEAFIPHTKGSRLGMPKKIDCVLPVIVTLIALPVLGAILYMVYKQCRDCWDKRHYRRMDFLIDGIYND
ncbi:uncharacterized protein LOC108624755 isoform X2 [Ceratina calcarata]|uniref:Uncharacterized protein LOC108624755 isoform X2 n=1 Tax=Ceratina calcarata TaxID=156304 RepID=A0AAJ7WAI8_9HYME|nr:uncharacterized protein LOC108624755 isoform X2 [Ceratina calcarata]